MAILLIPDQYGERNWPSKLVIGNDWKQWQRKMTMCLTIEEDREGQLLKKKRESQWQKWWLLLKSIGITMTRKTQPVDSINDPVELTDSQLTSITGLVGITIVIVKATFPILAVVKKDGKQPTTNDLVTLLVKPKKAEKLTSNCERSSDRYNEDPGKWLTMKKHYDQWPLVMASCMTHWRRRKTCGCQLILPFLLFNDRSGPTLLKDCHSPVGLKIDIEENTMWYNLINEKPESLIRRRRQCGSTSPNWQQCQPADQLMTKPDNRRC